MVGITEYVMIRLKPVLKDIPGVHVIYSRADTSTTGNYNIFIKKKNVGTTEKTITKYATDIMCPDNHQFKPPNFKSTNQLNQIASSLKSIVCSLSDPFLTIF